MFKQRDPLYRGGRTGERRNSFGSTGARQRGGPPLTFTFQKTPRLSAYLVSSAFSLQVDNIGYFSFHNQQLQSEKIPLRLEFWHFHGNPFCQILLILHCSMLITINPLALFDLCVVHETTDNGANTCKLETCTG